MARFVVTLSPEHRAELERMRIAFGCRSHADAIRALIERQAWEASDDKARGIAPTAPVDRLDPLKPARRPAAPNRTLKGFTATGEPIYR